MRRSASLCGLIVALSLRLSGQSVDYKAADSIADLYPHHSLIDERALVYKLTNSLTSDVQKFRAIYKWVCNNIENDYALNLKIQRQRQKLKTADALEAWNKEVSAMTFKNLLEHQRTVCTGYAYLIKELANYAGITCEMINGYGRTIQANIGGSGSINHTWNAVRLSDKWYLCDATWSSGSYDVQNSIFLKNFNEGYFLTEPSLFALNHYPLDSTWMLMGQGAETDFQGFLNGPLVYSDAFRYKIHPLLPKTFDVRISKGEIISFQFTGTIAETSYVKLQIDGTSVEESMNLLSSVGGRYTIDHQFVHRGTYAVHLLVDGKYAVTYHVKVE